MSQATLVPSISAKDAGCDSELNHSTDPLAKVTQARRALERAERAVKATQKELRDAVLRLGEALRHDPDETAEAISHLYWEEPQVSTQWLSQAFGLNQHEIRAIAGPGDTGLICQSCGRGILVRSRAEYAKATDTCDHCKRKGRDGRHGREQDRDARANGQSTHDRDGDTDARRMHPLESERFS